MPISRELRANARVTSGWRGNTVASASFHTGKERGRGNGNVAQIDDLEHSGGHRHPDQRLLDLRLQYRQRARAEDSDGGDDRAGRPDGRAARWRSPRAWWSARPASPSRSPGSGRAIWSIPLPRPAPAARGVHDAIDIMAPTGRPVIAAAPGTVEKIFFSNGGGGKTVYVRSRRSALVLLLRAPSGLCPGAGRRAAGPARPDARHASVRPAMPIPPARTCISRSTGCSRARNGMTALPTNPYPLLAGKQASG